MRGDRHSENEMLLLEGDGFSDSRRQAADTYPSQPTPAKQKVHAQRGHSQPGDRQSMRGLSGERREL